MKKLLIYIFILFIINNINPQDNTSDNKKDTKKEIIKKDSPEEKNKASDKKESAEKKDKKKDYIIFGKTILVLNLNTVNKIGIGFSIGGTVLALGGGFLLIYDYFGFKNILYKSSTYSEYSTLYIADIALLSAGLSCIVIGTALIFASIPMILYKSKDKKTAVFLNINSKLTFGINIKLNYKS